MAKLMISLEDTKVDGNPVVQARLRCMVSFAGEENGPATSAMWYATMVKMVLEEPVTVARMTAMVIEELGMDPCVLAPIQFYEPDAAPENTGEVTPSELTPT